MKIKMFTFNPFSTNCYVVACGGECAVIDPGCQTDAEIDELTSYIDANNLRVTWLLLTHAHIDHIFGCKKISERYRLPFHLHDGDLLLFQNGHIQAHLYGIPLNLSGVKVIPIGPGDNVAIGNLTLEVLHTPGHSPGSVSYVNHEHHVVFSGDVLFRGSVGRTDLWQGSMPQLLSSITGKLLPLGDHFEIYSGHGPMTTIASEKASNPFLT